MTQPNPFASLLRSRKFWLALVDAIVSSALLLAARFLSPGDVELVKQLIVIYQPVIIAVIAGIAYEDGQAAANPPAPALEPEIPASLPGHFVTYSRSTQAGNDKP